MKNLFKKILPYILSFDILVLSFFSCSVSVYAKDFMPTDIIAGIEYGIEYNDWEPFYRFLYESSDGLMYMFSQMGAFVTKDFVTWVDNNKKLASLANTVPVNQSLTDTKGNKVTFSKEFMAELKAILDEYIKTEMTKEENGGFYLLPTTDFTKVPANNFLSSYDMRTFRNIVLEKGCLGVATRYYSKLRFIDPFSDPDHPILLVGNLSSLNNYKNNPDARVLCNFFCANCWSNHNQVIMEFSETGKIYTSCSEAIHNVNVGNRGTTDCSYINMEEGDPSNFTFYSTTGEYIRVFVSQTAAKNYTVGNRKIYLTENYYNYMPEDLEVSIDDLQKSVDDLSKIIDELLKRIKDDTSEKEIMDLLKQILEALKNQQGTGGGGSGSGGDVTVNVDLTETNSWLSKIYEKVTQIFDKISKTASGVTDTAFDKIQETLDEILKQIKKIKHWTIADTLIDGVTGLSDMITDWITLIGDLLEDVDGGAETTVAAISSTMDDATKLLKTKFPFCIPWDVYFLVTFLAHEPETPVFNLPIRVPSAGIDECIEVDMSDFSGISTISRTLLTLIYCYGLLNLTMKVIPMVKEET